MFKTLMFLCLSLSPTVSQAASYALSDIDDTLFETRKEKQGIFSTPIKLFVIGKRANVLQAPLSSLPKVMLVSPRDYHQIETYLAKADNEPGAIKRVVTLEDGRTFSPGYYLIRDPDSYEYFREGVPGNNHFLKSVKLAEAQREKGTLKGMFWGTMEAFLSAPETATNFGTISARGQSPDELDETFEYMTRRRFYGIKHKPNKSLYYNVNRDEFDQYDIRGGFAKRKAEILEEFATHLARVPRTDSDLRLNREGDGVESLHYLIFADNDPLTMEYAFRVATKLSRNGKFPIKFGLFNAGNATQIRDSKRPQFFIVERGGTVRRASILEQAGELPGMTKTQALKFLKISCDRAALELEGIGGT